MPGDKKNGVIGVAAFTAARAKRDGEKRERAALGSGNGGPVSVAHFDAAISERNQEKEVQRRVGILLDALDDKGKKRLHDAVAPHVAAALNKASPAITARVVGNLVGVVAADDQWYEDATAFIEVDPKAYTRALIESVGHLCSLPGTVMNAVNETARDRK